MSLEIKNLTDNEVSKPNEHVIIDDSTLLKTNNEPLIDVLMSDLSSNTGATSPLHSPISSDQLLDLETPNFFETSNNYLINNKSPNLLDLDLPTSDLKIDVILAQSSTNENSKENRYSHSLLNRLKRMSVINTIDKELLLLEESQTGKFDNEIQNLKEDVNNNSQNLLEFDENTRSINETSSFVLTEKPNVSELNLTELKSSNDVNVNDLEVELSTRVKFDDLETKTKIENQISAENESSIINTETHLYLETELAQVLLLNSNVSDSDSTAQHNESQTGPLKNSRENLNSDLLDETETSTKDKDAKELKNPLIENAISESKVNKFLIDKHEQDIAERVYMEQKAVTPVDLETILNRNKSLDIVTKLFQTYDETQPEAVECNIEASAVVETNNETQIETKTLPKKKTCIIC